MASIDDVSTTHPVTVWYPGARARSSPAVLLAELHRGERDEWDARGADDVEEGVGRGVLARLAVAEDEGEGGIEGARADGVTHRFEHPA